MSSLVIIIGAGASGLMCAYRAARRGRSVLLIDHCRSIAQKVLASGGGKCNFSNRVVDHRAYLSSNPHFVKSALAGFTANDFIRLLDEHDIAYEERDRGQLFLTGPARQIRDMLLTQAREVGADLIVGDIHEIERDTGFRITGSFGVVEGERLVVATGGLSYPGLGASDLGYRLAQRFGHEIVSCRPALVPLVFAKSDRSRFRDLSGVSFAARVSIGHRSVEGDCLFTHRGLSGPAILRISPYWTKGCMLAVDWLPEGDLFGELDALRAAGSRIFITTVLARYLPARLAAMLALPYAPNRPLAAYATRELREIAASIRPLTFVPKDTEGYASAEVTAGGVATDEISSKTMESKRCPGLYFIGEVMDVTGDLGGFNLHWAWASGHAAGNAV